MQDLIEELERVSVGSRALSDEVLKAHGWRRFIGDSGIPSKFWWQSPSGDKRLQPDPARSVDDAIALLLDGWDGEVGLRGGYARLWPVGESTPEVTSEAAAPALALSAAILRARSA